jgi:hypothetical protein
MLPLRSNVRFKSGKDNQMGVLGAPSNIISLVQVIHSWESKDCFLALFLSN